MKKVVSITQCANRLQHGMRPATEEGSTREGGGLDCGAARRRGILLEFPRISQGPLFAAGIALLAIVGNIGSYHV